MLSFVKNENVVFKCLKKLPIKTSQLANLGERSLRNAGLKLFNVCCYHSANTIENVIKVYI